MAKVELQWIDGDIIGVTGAQGATGSVGMTGALGMTGAIGVTGFMGVTGLTGETGSMGMTGALGLTGARGIEGDMGPSGAPIVWRGEWAPSESYLPLNAVEYDGSSYMCILATSSPSDIPGSSPSHWELMAQGSVTNAFQCAGDNSGAAFTDGVWNNTLTGWNNNVYIPNSGWNPTTGKLTLNVSGKYVVSFGTQVLNESSNSSCSFNVVHTDSTGGAVFVHLYNMKVNGPLPYTHYLSETFVLDAAAGDQVFVTCSRSYCGLTSTTFGAVTCSGGGSGGGLSEKAKRVVYVSNKGSDSNEGFTSETAVLSLDVALQNAANARSAEGDLYYWTVECRDTSILTIASGYVNPGVHVHAPLATIRTAGHSLCFNMGTTIQVHRVELVGPADFIVTLGSEAEGKHIQVNIDEVISLEGNEPPYVLLSNTTSDASFSYSSTWNIGKILVSSSEGHTWDISGIIGSVGADPASFTVGEIHCIGTATQPHGSVVWNSSAGSSLTATLGGVYCPAFGNLAGSVSGGKLSVTAGAVVVPKCVFVASQGNAHITAEAGYFSDSLGSVSDNGSFFSLNGTWYTGATVSVTDSPTIRLSRTGEISATGTDLPATLEHKIVAGDNVTIALVGTALEISSTGGGGSDLQGTYDASTTGAIHEDATRGSLDLYGQSAAGEHSVLTVRASTDLAPTTDVTTRNATISSLSVFPGLTGSNFSTVLGAHQTTLEYGSNAAVLGGSSGVYKTLHRSIVGGGSENSLDNVTESAVLGSVRSDLKTIHRSIIGAGTFHLENVTDSMVVGASVDGGDVELGGIHRSLVLGTSLPGATGTLFAGTIMENIMGSAVLGGVHAHSIMNSVVGGGSLGLGGVTGSNTNISSSAVLGTTTSVVSNVSSSFIGGLDTSTVSGSANSTVSGVIGSTITNPVNSAVAGVSLSTVTAPFGSAIAGAQTSSFIYPQNSAMMGVRAVMFDRPVVSLASGVENANITNANNSAILAGGGIVSSTVDMVTGSLVTLGAENTLFQRVSHSAVFGGYSSSSITEIQKSVVALGNHGSADTISMSTVLPGSDLQCSNIDRSLIAGGYGSTIYRVSDSAVLAPHGDISAIHRSLIGQGASGTYNITDSVVWGTFAQNISRSALIGRANGGSSNYVEDSGIIGGDNVTNEYVHGSFIAGGLRLDNKYINYSTILGGIEGSYEAIYQSIVGGGVGFTGIAIFNSIAGGGEHNSFSTVTNSLAGGGINNTLNLVANSLVGGGVENTLNNAHRSIMAGGSSVTVNQAYDSAVLSNVQSGATGINRVLLAVNNELDVSGLEAVIVAGTEQGIIRNVYDGVMLGGTHNTLAASGGEIVGSAIISGSGSTVSASGSMTIGSTDVLMSAAGSIDIGGEGNILLPQSNSSISIGGSGNIFYGGTHSAMISTMGSVMGLSPTASVILGGSGHTITEGASQSVALGGVSNKLSAGASQSAIVSGAGGVMGSGASQGVLLGGANGLHKAYRGILGGGTNNTLEGSASNGVLLGGTFSYSDGISSVILGGSTGMITGSSNYAAVISGESSTVSNSSHRSGTFVGLSNTISNGSHNSGIVGGTSLTITSNANNSVLVGGTNSIAINVDNSVALGGQNNGVYADNTVVLGGRNGTSVRDSEVVTGAGLFYGSTGFVGEAQRMSLVMKALVTEGTTGMLTLPNSGLFVMVPHTSLTFDINVVATAEGPSESGEDSASWSFKLLAKAGATGCSLVANNRTYNGGDINFSSTDIFAGATGLAVTLSAAGPSEYLSRWVASLDVTQIRGTSSNPDPLRMLIYTLPPT